MARRIVHQLVDDLDGKVLEADEGETIHFSLGNSAYEIDLSKEHAAELRSALNTYMKAGRRAGSTTKSSGKRSARNPETTAIREWASANGYQVSERGRVPANIVEAYRAAH